jgi:hypothetical protein
MITSGWPGWKEGLMEWSSCQAESTYSYAKQKQYVVNLTQTSFTEIQ